MPGTVVPKYVAACAACAWALHVWRRDDPSQVAVVPYTCLSWRHAGECRQWKGAQDFARIKEAVTKAGSWVYVVLTYAQGDWPDKWLQYREGVRHWSKLRKRLTRAWGAIRYIQTWERHQKGGAHVNVVISCPALAKACKGEGWKRVRRQWLEPAAVACGFGPRTWLEPVRDVAAMSGYLVKLARELTGADGKDQIPEDAPPHFRRIRASRGLLPPPVVNPDWTGRLIMAPADRLASIVPVGREKAICT